VNVAQPQAVLWTLINIGHRRKQAKVRYSFVNATVVGQFENFCLGALVQTEG
jgi:hypothetical protein